MNWRWHELMLMPKVMVMLLVVVMVMLMTDCIGTVSFKWHEEENRAVMMCFDLS